MIQSEKHFAMRVAKEKNRSRRRATTRFNEQNDVDRRGDLFSNPILSLHRLWTSIKKDSRREKEKEILSMLNIRVRYPPCCVANQMVASRVSCSSGRRFSLESFQENRSSEGLISSSASPTSSSSSLESMSNNEWMTTELLNSSSCFRERRIVLADFLPWYEGT